MTPETRSLRPVTWPCPTSAVASDRNTVDEFAMACDRARAARLLIVPALFDEANRMRRFTIELMRRLDEAGIDSFLPDLPGTNESLQALADVTLEHWQAAVGTATRHFAATAVLGVRGGCLLAPDHLPQWHYAPVKGAAILRQMLRARMLSARETGREEQRDVLETTGRHSGIIISGHALGADFYCTFEKATPSPSATVIEQAQVGGAGLWLRAEPDEDAGQCARLAELLMQGLLA